MNMPLFRLSILLPLILATLPIAYAAEPPPNIVLMFIDDLGYGDIGPFGNDKVRTPNLDRFAREGMKFTSFYATPVCSMSRACLMTGCYNARVSVPGVLFPPSRNGLHPHEITLAEIAKEKGYATACFGKWHLGHGESLLPTKQGFDSYLGIPYSNDMALDTKSAKFASNCVFREGFTAETALQKGVQNKVPLMRGSEVIEYPVDQATLTQRYTEGAEEFIATNRERSFFLYLPHNMVHHPLAASPEFKGKSAAGLLGDAIEEIDWSVGRILETLKKYDLDSKTLFIFTSDNGAAAGSALPWRGKKGTNFEGGVREPCLMRWPGKIPAGTTCGKIAGNIDLLPTFAALLGVKPPTDRVLDGRDITSLMIDPKAGPVRNVHLYFNAQSRLQAIRKDDWKLFLISPDQPRNKGKQAEGKKKGEEATGPQLYNLEADPGETTNVAEKNPRIVAELSALAQERLEEIEKHRRPAGTWEDGK